MVGRSRTASVSRIYLFGSEAGTRGNTQGIEHGAAHHCAQAQIWLRQECANDVHEELGGTSRGGHECRSGHIRRELQVCG